MRHLCLALLGALVLVGWLPSASAQSWRGNTVSYRACCYRQVRVCRYRWWGRCCSYKWISQGYTCTKYRCAAGWTHRGDFNCNTPVCRPSCQNRGTCTSPGKCTCPVQWVGYRCEGATCSHLAPCFPGTCQNRDGCHCDSGFRTPSGGGKLNYCLQIEDSGRDDVAITEMQVRLSFWPRWKSPPMELHYLLADSTNTPDTDLFWTNRRPINRIETTCSSQYDAPDIGSSRPPFISDSALGIVGGRIVVSLFKVGHSGSTFESLNHTINCERSVSSQQPEKEFYNCSASNANFDRLIEHKDRLLVTYYTEGGGFREVLDRNTGSKSQQLFRPVTRTKAVEFRFDLRPPEHCLESRTAPCLDEDRMRSMLNVPDLTREPVISITWGNWADGDGDSGMHRYAWEVFKMTKASGTDIEIRDDQALKPLVNTEVFHANYTPQSFRLPEPGLYSVILEAGDLANNTKYVRRLVLYDPNPTVSADPSSPGFYVETAFAGANFTFQNNSGSVNITWKSYFRNALHEDNNLLGRVRAYPATLQDDTEENKAYFRKVVPYNTTKQDDWEGARTANPIPNRRGIVNFQIQHARDNRGGRYQTDPSLNDPRWIDLDLNETFTYPDVVNNGETLTVWVRATDVLGGHKMDRRRVTVDSSAPSAGAIAFSMNTPVAGMEFTSTFQMDAKDRESGVAHIVWTFARKSNGTVIYRETVPAQQGENCTEFNCTCNAMGQCFAHTQHFAVSNCRMLVEKEAYKQEVIIVTADVVNMAGVVTQRTMEKDRLDMLNGTQSYAAPQNVTVKRLTESSCTIQWDFPPSCFTRTGLWVMVSGESNPRPIHKDAREFDIAGLQAGQQYNIQLVTDFAGKGQSYLAAFTFTTERQRETETETEREIERETHRERQTEGERETERERDRERLVTDLKQVIQALLACVCTNL